MDGQFHKNCLKAHLSRLKIHLNLVDSLDNYHEDSHKGYFAEVDLSILKIA